MQGNLFFPHFEQNIKSKKILSSLFSQNSTSISAPAKQVLQLDCKETIYLIVNGMVKQYFLNEEGKQKIFMFLEKGQILGEITLFQGPIDFFVTQAITDISLVSISKSTLKEVISAHPEILPEFLSLETEKLRYLMAQIYEETYLPIKDRLFCFLERIALYQSIPSSLGNKITVRLTHEELASHVGTTRSTVTRSLKELSEEGKIQIHSHWIYIKQ